MYDCPVWGFVDFGNGVRTKVRCTVLGPHEDTEHFCHVAIDVPGYKDENVHPLHPSSQRRNVFENPEG